MFQGNYFSEADYSTPIDDKINVVLGSSYQELFDVGNEFIFFYLETNFQARVIGFMNEGVEIPASDKMVTVDNYIILPSLIDSLENDNFKKHTQYYSTKLAGIILYKSEDEFKIAKEEVEAIFQPYDLPYTIIESEMSKAN